MTWSLDNLIIDDDQNNTSSSERKKTSFVKDTVNKLVDKLKFLSLQSLII